ncbi:hypothetical protein PHYBLDRAFT_63934 [Phycomyces blakesleeanus NRRL 1555(-)]|uniref:Uncharacterized protein n=2 Tax=Mucorales TaxID=4827 RepID=A0A162XDC5_PHYB8|nr:hypothetical protein PHYBLDRAFT_63934 [Phycomyces blakesleeanus NRRL 1555(-)]OAD74115.1 hypothetical protein PHYBLDRAFT_63934 [Phycomyces blakesleeanus NRRL 1555(-)]|eukprot:XP_018292155.1 hypothetical protein PHYBLDRAFT_63934 [Phycomyces blakesleeanus NRRL 1555(-)]
MSFDLKDSSKAKTTTIFVKESAWKEAAEIAQNNNAASIASYDLIYQLRQLCNKEEKLAPGNTIFVVVSILLWDRHVPNVFTWKTFIKGYTTMSQDSRLPGVGTTANLLSDQLKFLKKNDQVFPKSDQLTVEIQYSSALVSPCTEQ